MSRLTCRLSGVTYVVDSDTAGGAKASGDQETIRRQV